MVTPADFGLPARFPSFREYPGFDQLAIATEMADTQQRFVMLDSPPGSGKSLMYMTTAALLGARTLVLVGTKGLQDQVVGDFGGADCGIRARDIRGHRNYPCMARSGLRGAIDTGDDADFEFECGARDRCGWRRDVDLAGESRTVVSNYALWMALARFSDPELLGRFDLLVCDEGHTTPEWLTSACAVEITKRDVRDVLRVDWPRYHYSDLASWAGWAADVARKGRSREESEVPRTAKEARRLRRLVRELEEVAGMPVPVWDKPVQPARAGGIIRIEKPRRSAGPGTRVPWVGMETKYGVRFSPIWGLEYAERYLFRGIPKVVVCSGTLVPEHGDQLGIPRDPDVRRFVEVPSSFPPERRPVWYVPVTRVDHKTSDAEWRGLVNKIDRLGESRADLGKGLIHSQSYVNASRVVELSRLAEFMVSHRDSRGLAEAIRTFDDVPWGVLVSPSIREGFDFKGDRARWQVILKVPFPDSRDPLTAARIAADKNYRYVLIAQTLVQMAMRIVRSEDDYGETFIFDRHFGYVRDLISVSAWFRASWKVAGDVPPVLDPSAPVGGAPMASPIRVIRSRKSSTDNP